MRKIRAIILSVLLICVSVLFSGCSSYVSVYRTEVNDGTYTCSIDIYADHADVEILEKDSVGTFEGYINTLIEECGKNEYGIQSYAKKDKSGNYYITIAVTADSGFVKNEDRTVKTTKGLFFNSNVVRFKNPLDRFKNAYKNGLTEKPQKGTDMYFVWVLLNGTGSLKSFSEYFGVDESFADQLVLNFYLKTRMLSTSSAPTEYLLAKRYFKWTTTVSTEDGYIEYTVQTVNSWVWYATAILIAGAVALVLFLVARKSKRMPALKDDSEIERLRVMRKTVPPNAKIVQPPQPIPEDERIFGEDTDKENKQ